MLNQKLKIGKFTNQVNFFSTKNLNNFGDPKKYTTFKEHDLEVISLFVGCLLGDASATRGRIVNSVKLKNTKISFAQSEKNGVYLQSIKDFLVVRKYAANSVLKIKGTYDKRTKKTYFSSAFATFSFKSLNELHSLFYREANDFDRQKGRGNERFIKIIPQNIAEYLTPKALAHWYMDDGSFHIYAGNALFCTNSFTKQEVELLIITLQNVFNLKTTLRKVHSLKEQYNIIIPKSEMSHFILIIKPYMVPSMFYKLGLGFDESVIPLKKAEINPSSLKPAMRPKKVGTSFTEEVISLFVGGLLGGAAIERTNKSSNIRFTVTIKKQFYANLIHEKLKAQNLCKKKELTITKGKTYSYVRFGTLSFESLNDLHTLFYMPTKQKVVPKTIDQHLTVLAFVVWVIAFGSFSGKVLSTICNTEEEAHFLKSALKKNFDLDCEIFFRKPCSYRLRFSDNEWKKVIGIIQKELGADIFEQWSQISHTS